MTERLEVRIVLEVTDAMGHGSEHGLRVHVEDAPLYFGPLTSDGRKVALDAVRRQLELELDRLAGRACGGR